MVKTTYTRSFYAPHDPLDSAFTNSDPVTGEVYPSMTKQSFVDECDINNILAEYKTSGQLKHINEKAAQGVYADLPNGLDFQESLNTVIRAEESFATLPSAVRARFGNDPEQFLTFMADPANQDEAIKMGLAQDNRPTPPEPLAVRITNPPEAEKTG
ncbi:DNA pilot protein [Blackfly microvirus SF02]|uniref:DNA pilot protein n=1 Tax=Blackfly microvirus SF02 TaxID=2576452 RepID=A0A4P8PSG1_9VIRU|nr:DNA pilot protein [Blackfly microvirus SF02]